MTSRAAISQDQIGARGPVRKPAAGCILADDGYVLRLAISVSEKSRPAKSGMRKVRKRPGPTALMKIPAPPEGPTARNRHIILPSTVAQRHCGQQGCGLDLRHGSCTLQNAAPSFDERRTLQWRLAGVKQDHGHSAWINPRTLRQQPHQAAASNPAAASRTTDNAT